MADRMELNVARAMFDQDHDEGWDQGYPDTKGIYLNNARAALSACHHEELVEALEDIAAHWNGSETQTAMSDACLHNVEIARAALAKVEASDA